MSGMQGLDALMRKLDALGGNTQKALKMGLRQAAKQVQGDAKMLAPVDSGRLRNSIQTRVTEVDGDLAGIVSTNVEYAPYVEFGTGQRGEASGPPKWDGPLAYRQDWVGMPAQPFLYPGYAQNKAKLPKMIANPIVREIRKLGG